MQNEKVDIIEDTIEITFSEDDLDAFLIVRQNADEPCNYTVDKLVGFLKDAGVTKGIDRDVLEKIISDRIYGEFIKVAQGKKPEDGNDGWYEFLFETDIDKSPKILKDGSVDYSEYGDVPTVVENQEIAIYHPATESVDGENVKGEIVVAKKGKDLAKLKGKGFYVDDTGLKYIAKYDGKITYENDRLVIDKELVVEGDVSFTTGDVEFQNDIHIRGNVLSGVSVVSEKGSIIVDGYVEAAKLRAKCNIALKNGMQGNGKGEIVAGGDVSGKFFEQVSIKCKGDVNANAIMNSHIDCGQDIIVSGKYGIIIGGEVRATRYIKATIIGNMSEVKTKIFAGVEGDLFAMLAKCEKDKEQADEDLNKINRAIEQINLAVAKTGRTDLQQKKMLLMRSKIEKDTSISELEKKKQEIVEQMGKANLAKVTIEKTIYPGTSISINGVRVMVDEEAQHVEYARRGSGLIVYNIGE